MKKLIVLLFLMFSAAPVFSVTTTNSDSVQTAITVNFYADNSIEVTTNKKHGLLHKIGSLLHRRNQADSLTEEEINKANKQANSGFFYSLLGIVVFPFFAIPGLILSRKALKAEKNTPNTLTPKMLRYARAGRVMGWIGFTLLMIIVPIIILVIATGSWR